MIQLVKMIASSFTTVIIIARWYTDGQVVNHQAVLSLVEQEGEEVTASMKAKFDVIFLLLTGKTRPCTFSM